MKSLEEQMSTYAAYHQDARNKATHFIGVPVIVLSLFIPLAWLLVGRDFRFGAQRKGDFAALEGCGFALEAMPDVAFEGERVSSSAVRAALESGDFARAERLLGRPYSLSGRVIHGAKLGHDLGFPTANIALRQRPPLSGIYVVEVEALGPAVASVGLRPTVNPVATPLLEVHFLERQLSCLQPVVMARDAVSSDKNSWFGSWLLCSGHRQSAENHQQNNDPTSAHYCSLRGTNILQKWLKVQA